MKKRDLIERLEKLLEEKGMYRIDGVNPNSNKASIQAAIKCLELTDEELDEYMTVFKLKFPGSYNAIISKGNWKIHPHNRIYVYQTAKMILNNF